MRKDLSRLDDWFTGKWKKDKVVIEELKQKISAQSEKLRRCLARGNQYRQNKLFRCNQKALLQELGGNERSRKVPPDAEEVKEF